VEWFLYTRRPVTDAAEARQVVEWYACRWIVEEYHKGLKTGCRIEALQFTAEARLEPMIALLSIAALSLLQMRDAARDPEAPQRPATQVASADDVRLLSLWRHGETQPAWTARDFHQALARLGGHQNRNGDGPPGWIVLWRGWQCLRQMAAGAALQHRERSG
jgi:Transposase DDE domain